MLRNLTSSIGCLLLLSGVQAQNIVGYEYWFDQNDAARTYVPVTPSATLTLANAQLNTTGLSLGQHQACLRWKDQPAAGQARWSSVVCRTLQVGQPGPWEIIALRYWIGSPVNDSDPLIRYKYFDTPQDTINYIGLLEMCGYAAGLQTLKLQLLDNHGQWSSVVARSVTLSPAGNLGAPSITASATTFCPGQVVTFTATPQTGPGFATPTGYNWQVPIGNGWSSQSSSGNTIVVTIGSVAGTVQAAATNLCGSSPFGSFAVNIPSVPDQPGVILGPLQACIGSDATFSTAQVSGVTYAWTITPWGGNGGPSDSIQTTIGATNATITVTPYNACGVAGPPRTETIIVSAPPNAGEDGTLAICSNGPATSLFTQLQGTPGTGGVWRHNGVVVSGIYNPATNDPGVYTYTVSGSGPCPDVTANVVVTEPQMPNAGFDDSLTLCTNAVAVDMTSQLGGAPQNGGSWSGPSPTTGQYDPATMTPGTYVYTMNGIAPCSNASATLTISEDQAPNAGVGGTLELCAGSAPTLLLNYLGGSPSFAGTWTGPSGVFAGIFQPGQSAEGTYVYTVPGTGACTDANASLEVNVMDLVLSGIDGPTSVPVVETLLYTALPALADADSIVWSLPPGWSWNDPDHTDSTAYVLPPAEADTGSICAQANGGPCDGNVVCIFVDVNVGLEDQADDCLGLVVYPNPSNGRFNLQLAGPPELTEVQVLNSFGQQVAALQLSSGNAFVDLGSLATGAYTLHWVSQTRRGTKPLVVVD